MKSFLQVSLIIACLVVLWYLLTYNPNETTRVSMTDNSLENTLSKPAINTQNEYPPDDFYLSTEEKVENGIETITETVNEVVESVENSANNTVDFVSSEKMFNKKRFVRDNQWGEYQGPMLNGKPDGFAVCRYDNGNLYIGKYRFGKRNGQGNSIYKSGKVRMRDYVDGEKVPVDVDTKAAYTFKKLKYSNEGKAGTYEGPTKNNQPEGFGVFTYSNGDMYVGVYKNGKRHGAGNFIYKNGTVEDVEYRNGKLVGDYSSNTPIDIENLTSASF